jgi:hypothetical protein
MRARRGAHLIFGPRTQPRIPGRHWQAMAARSAAQRLGSEIGGGSRHGAGVAALGASGRAKNGTIAALTLQE